MLNPVEKAWVVVGFVGVWDNFHPFIAREVLRGRACG